MGSYWTLSAGGRQLLVGKNHVPDKVMWLFTTQDRVVDRAKLIAYETSSDVETYEQSDASPSLILSYRTTVGALRERLALQGFSTERVTRHASALIQSELEDDDGILFAGWREAAHKLGDARSQLKAAIRNARRLSGWSRLNFTSDPELQYLDSTWTSLASETHLMTLVSNWLYCLGHLAQKPMQSWTEPIRCSAAISK